MTAANEYERYGGYCYRTIGGFSNCRDPAGSWDWLKWVSRIPSMVEMLAGAVCNALLFGHYAGHKL